MECVATVDFAKRELAKSSIPVTVANIKADIARDTQWKPKLGKPHFADTEIKKAIRLLDRIF